MKNRFSPEDEKRIQDVCAVLIMKLSYLHEMCNTEDKELIDPVKSMLKGLMQFTTRLAERQELPNGDN